jgi:hypothetical protein
LKEGLYDNRDEQSKLRFYQVLKDLKPGEYIYQIKKNMPVRSNNQNRYYWAVLKVIAVKSGYTEDQLHEYYKKRYNGIEVLGEVIGNTTGDLDTAEFKIYVSRVKEHGKDFFECVFVEPEDKDYSLWEQMTRTSYNSMFLAS